MVVVRFHQRYYDSIVNGTKTVTVRWDEPISVGPALFVFEDHPECATVDGDVLTITRHELARLTPEQVHLSADTDMVTYRRALGEHYPDIPEGARVDVVTFAVARPG